MNAANLVLLVSVLFGYCGAEKRQCKIDDNCTLSCKSDDIIDLDSSTDCKTVVVKLSKTNLEGWAKLKHYEIEKMVMFQNNQQNLQDLVNGTNIKKLYLYQNNITELKTGMFGENKLFETLALNRNQIKVLQKKSIPAVEVLYLQYNLIESLNADVFVNISRVKILRLDNNNIQMITASSLMGLKAEFLDLSYNRIEHLEDESIPEVKHLKIRNNRLTSIDSKMFVNIANTIELDVSFNKITHISENSFFGVRELTNLSLSNNLIASLEMQSIPTVKNLNLSYNLISFINSSMFVGVDYLTTLDISYNCIELNDFLINEMNVTKQKDNQTCNERIKVFTFKWIIVSLTVTLIVVVLVIAIALSVCSRKYAESSTYYLKNAETTKTVSNVYEMS